MNTIYIIIPNYNGCEHLEDCFKSLRGQTYKEFNIILVDNNSSDDSVQFTKQNYPECSIIGLEKNYGFAKAINKGIKNALENDNCSFILLLNNDIECDTNFFSEMMNGFISPDTGSVACKMLNYYKRNVIDDAGNFIRWNDFPLERGQNEEDKGQYDKPEFLFGACAGAALYKREVFEKAGLLDEDFISYLEDVDFSFRLQRMGFKCFYNPKAVCYHKRMATSKSNVAYRIYLTEKNITCLRIKNYPVNILFKYSLLFLVRGLFIYVIKNIFWHSPKAALYGLGGFLKGLFEIPKSVNKRLKINKLSIVELNDVARICVLKNPNEDI